MFGKSVGTPVTWSVGKSVFGHFRILLRLAFGTIQLLDLWFLGFRTGPVNAREFQDIYVCNGTQLFGRLGANDHE